MSNIVIQGQGVVGLATERLLRFCSSVDRIEFDDPPKRIYADNWDDADWNIICVPTPLSSLDQQSLEIKSVVDAVVNAQSRGFTGTYVIRSTLSLDTIGSFDWLGEKLIIWPEFVRADHWEQDAVNPKLMLFGGEDSVRFSNLFGMMPRTHMMHVSPRTAVLIKLAVNAFLATKVTFANQMHALCQEHGIDYALLEEAFKHESRLGKTHWSVPGPDGQMGFGGACLPKDTAALMHELELAGLDVGFFRSLFDINNKVRNDSTLWQLAHGE